MKNLDEVCEEFLESAGPEKSVCRVGELESEVVDQDHRLLHQAKAIIGLQQQLKVMAEDRDEYQKRYMSALEGDNLSDMLCDATEDERWIAQAFISKLMGEGRREHGAMDLSRDDRDLLCEAGDELDDCIAYLMMFRRKIEIGKGR